MSNYEFTYKRELGCPFTRADLEAALERIPTEVNARITVTTHMGGSQRDPYPTGYTLVAKWEE